MQSEAQGLNGAQAAQELIIATLGDGVVVLDAEQRILSANAAAERAMGRPVAALIGKPFGEAWPHAADVLARRNAVSEEMQLSLPVDGTGRFFELRSVPWAGPEREAQGSVVTIRDVSERRQREAEAARRSAELAALNRLSQSLSRLMTPAQVIDLITDVVGQELDNKNLFVALYDETHNAVSFPVYTIQGERTAQGARRLGNSLTDYVIRQRKPLLLRGDASAAAAAMGVQPQGEPGRCFLAVPMLAGDELLGVIGIVDYQRETAYDAGHQALLSTIAAQAAIALENARLFAAVRERADGLALLYETTHDLATHQDISGLMQTIVQRATGMLSAPSGAVYVSDNAQHALHLAFKNGELPYLETMQWGEGVSGQVAQTGQTLIIDDYRTWVYRSFQIEGTAWCQAVLGVPLRYMGDLKGVLLICDTSPTRRFTKDEAHLITLFGGQVAGAMHQADLFTRVQALARTDDLTGLINRRYFTELAQAELQRARRFQHPLSVLMLDIDHFKQVNDAYGHPVGDQVLCTVAECCQRASRESDHVCRYGGEEFALLLVETGAAGAVEFAERLRALVAQTPSETAAGPINVTISIGVADFRADAEDWPALISRADRALYDAKQAGRNRVVAGVKAEG